MVQNILKSYLKKLLGIKTYRKYRPEEFAYFGDSVYIGPDVSINIPKRVYLNNHSVIHSGTQINSIGGLYIGEYSGISYNCIIFTGDHKIHGAKSIPFDEVALLKPVVIEDFVSIGAHVSIAPGVKIGTGAIVGIGSVVITDVPPLAIVIGNPAKILSFRRKEEFETLKKGRKFNSLRIDHYIEEIPLMYKAKYKNYLSLLNLTNL